MSERRRPFEVVQGGVPPEGDTGVEKKEPAVKFYEEFCKKIRELVAVDTGRVLDDEELAFIVERMASIGLKPKTAIDVRNKMIALQEINARFPDLIHLFIKTPDGNEDEE